MVREAVLGMVVLLTTGCNSGMYEKLSRTTNDPEVVAPRVGSFIESNAVLVAWDRDEGADEYILERAEDKPGRLVYEVVYRGNKTSYEDRRLGNEQRYIYRLSKRRGRETFGPSSGVLGVSSLVSRDIYWNDTRASALRLESIDYIANIYYYRAYGGQELIDEDWYYIEIPAMRQASVVVNDSQVAESDQPTHFYYYEYRRDSHEVTQLRDFWIINNELVTKRYYFKLYPAKSKFVDAGTAVPAGGKIVQYRISIGSIQPIKIGGI